MQTLSLQRTFLKKPKNGVVFLFAIVLFALAFSLVTRSDLIIQFPQRFAFDALPSLAVVVFVPELVSLLVLMALINLYHQFMKLDTLDLSLQSIIRYELKFIPLFLVAFFIFFPITLHIRFLLREFPHYDLGKYMSIYMAYGFAFDTYLFYLPFVIILGYTLLNVSMFVDFAKMESFTVPQNNAINEQSESIEISEEESKKEAMTAEEDYRTLVEVKTKHGTNFLLAEECYYFMLIGTYDYFVEHPEGRFKIIQSISVLEASLDPAVFFRCNRKAIINLNFVNSFVYLDKGRYNISMKPPIAEEFTITKARMEVFKETLKKNIELK